ncbi:MAG: glycosyltransferase [Treponema sp.]|nr:glycosyltransferase [Treponema sp.]
MDKINLLFITYTHSNGGGAENVLTTLVNNLNPNKYNITIQEIDAYNVKKEPLKDYVTLRNRPLRYVGKKTDIFWRFNYSLLHNNPSILKTVFRWKNFDIVVSWNYQLPSFALLAFSDEYKVNLFHTDLYDLDLSRYPEMKKEYELQKRVFDAADRIVTISNYSMQSAKDLFPTVSGKLGFVHNGTNADVILGKASAEMEKAVSLNNNVVKFISIGRLDERKNFSLVLDALGLLNNKGLDFQYLILGQGNLEKALRQQAAALGIEDKVIFLGYIQNPYPYLKASDILCMSSTAEGWPTVVVESMVLGKPFVTTPVAGAGDELSNKETCGFVSDWNAEEYAQKLEKLIKDEELRKMMGDAGKKNISHYSINNSVAEFENQISDAEKLTIRKKSPFFAMLFYIFAYATGYVWVGKNAVGFIFHLRQLIKDFSVIKAGKCAYRFAGMLCSIIFVPLLFVPRMILAAGYCMTGGR